MSRTMPLMIADTSRVLPDSLPQEPMAFKRWADHACVEWPLDLMAKSVEVTRGTVFRWYDEKYAEFVAAYTEWYVLSEGQKEDLMRPEQVASFRRSFHRIKARLAAHG